VARAARLTPRDSALSVFTEKSSQRAALEKHLAKYQSDPDSAKKLTSVGESAPPKGSNVSELAAYTMVASLLLNLDETLNKN